MCEFCLKHGEGKKWYLEASNYSEDLLSDIRRRRYIEHFAQGASETARSVDGLDKLEQSPRFIQSLMRTAINRHMKKNHFGQVVPMEDIERIFDFVNSIVRVACYCRYATLGREKRYCYGVSLGPNGGKLGQIMSGVDNSYLNGPDGTAMETVSKEEALAAFREHEQEGLCHTVWTFRAPFIGGICNCDRSDCSAMRCTVSHKLPVMFRAEYVAEVSLDCCTGCRQCMRVCQFGAISFSAARRKAVIDARACYGCGICRAACHKDAIELKDRLQVPAAAKRW